jgi:phosphotriesterase-related protein
MIRTVLGDRNTVVGRVFAHEHLIIDSPLIADRWPHILLNDLDAAVAESRDCHAAGVTLMVDAMPAAAGRDVVRLAEIARRTGVDVVCVTGLHHDRYYGPQHWTNRVSTEELTELFVADLTEGVDEFDYTSPIVRRTSHRAGLIKVATSGSVLDTRDRRNLTAAARASVRTGAPILTHCEGGKGALAQVEYLVAEGVPAPSVIVSHLDKAADASYAVAVAATGATLELDQNLRQYTQGLAAPCLDVIDAVVAAGFERSIVLGTDGARRSLWRAFGGAPGLAWLATDFPRLLMQRGLTVEQIELLTSTNAVRALSWRPV